ncbi:MAG: chemotaxis protein CheX [Spongiibacteraceae bacterium]|nr:chemotaxis protein CheX [Spongiibacteraceae bacterium]MBN4055606.1 chemotaxis protein CheX [bacterium AH-315-K03]
MNAKYINPLLESTVSVLSTMATVIAKPGKPFPKEGHTALGDITSMINLSENGQTKASLAISFSQEAALDIAQNMLGDRSDKIEPSTVDMVGELTNMITGSAKRLYADLGHDFELTLPHTCVGHDKPVKHSIDGETIVIPFSTNAGNFYVELCIDE